MTNEQKPEALRLAEWIEEDMTCNGDAEIAAELRRQHAEISALRADAERYRWIRGPALHGDKQRIIGYKGEFLDAKIDAAMKNGA